MFLTEWICKFVIWSIIDAPVNIIFQDAFYNRDGSIFNFHIIHPMRFVWNVLSRGELGFGESYRDGDWRLDEDADLGQFMKTMAAQRRDGWIEFLKHWLPMAWIRRITFDMTEMDTQKAQSAVEESYDATKHMCDIMLDDKYGMYTSAYYKNPSDSLQEAQINKLTLVAEKSKITGTGQGQRLLDIGCGYGGAMRFMKERFPDLTVMGNTNSPEMAKSAADKYEEQFNVANSVTHGDYRELEGELFDAIISLGMIEHIGENQYADYASKISSLLRKGGRVVIQTVNAKAWNNPTVHSKQKPPADSFVMEYIFPGAHIPHLDWIHEHFSKDFWLIHTETFGHSYELTVRDWRLRLESHQNVHQDIPEKDFRGFQYYLAWCEAGFGNEYHQLSQMVFEKK